MYIPIYQEASDDAVNIEGRLKVADSNPTVIWSADNKILYSVAAVRRKVVDLFDPKYPSYVRYALVAAEDRRFFDHKGVDPVGMGRIVLGAIQHRRIVGGGSTISMQLAKNLVNGDDRSLRRKLKDIATAQQIESLKSKPEILNLYANTSYFGQHAFGIERAAEIYFGKKAERLTVGEAAMLARCVRLPSRVNPVRSLQKMLPLRDYVLGVMKDEGWITQGQYDEGVHEVPNIVHQQTHGETRIVPAAGYFVRHVLSQLKADFPDVDFQSGGYNIHTSLNFALQKRAVAAVRQVLADNADHKVNDGAIVVMNSEGRILCEVGGPDYERQQFNMVTQGDGRQPGSAFKAIVYTVALKNGVIHPGSYLSNARIHKRLTNGHYWDPQNASRKEDAPGYSLETAFALSVNRPAINTLIKTGVENVVAGAHDIFGIKSHLGRDDSLALGTSEVKPIEMLEAYSVFMLGGNRAEPQPIVRVTGPNDEPGHPLREYAPIVHQEVLAPAVAKQMDEILKTPVAYGTATYAQAVPNARGKTGTTNSAKDAWFCGYSDGLVGVGWVGHSAMVNGTPHALAMSSSVFGGTVTVKIWTAVMQAAHRLNLAKGVVATPGTTVGASEETEPPARPIRDRSADETRPDPGETRETPKEPVTIEPSPESLPAPDGSAPTADPDGAKTDPPVDPPVRTPPDEPPPEEPARRERPRRADPPRREEETVEVNVCVDTGLRANDYCPETVTRRFPKGRAPRRSCTLHHG